MCELQVHGVCGELESSPAYPLLQTVTFLPLSLCPPPVLSTLGALGAGTGPHGGEASGIASIDSRRAAHFTTFTYALRSPSLPATATVLGPRSSATLIIRPFSIILPLPATRPGELVDGGGGGTAPMSVFPRACRG